MPKKSTTHIITLTHPFPCMPKESTTPIITLTHPFPCAPKGVYNLCYNADPLFLCMPKGVNDAHHDTDPPLSMCAKRSQWPPSLRWPTPFHVCQKESMIPIITLSHPFPCVPKLVNNPSLLWPTFSMCAKVSQQPLITLTHLFHVCQS